MSGIAIVGRGRMAHAHVAAWTALGLGPAIRYLCARTPGAPIPGAERARRVARLEDALADPEVDMVSICTPPSTHAGFAVQALAAGVNVLVEKPVATSLAEAARIADAARHSAAIVMVAQLLRFESGYRRLQADIASGRIGQVRTVSAARAVPPARGGWFLEPEISGGPLVDLATHDFDQANLALGRPRGVASVCEGVASAGPYLTTVEYESGARARIETRADSGPGVLLASRFEAVGSAGRARYEVLETPRGRESLYRLDPGEPAPPVEPAVEDPFVAEVRYFAECVANGSPPRRSDVASATAALAVGLAARRSAQCGSLTVEVD